MSPVSVRTFPYQAPFTPSETGAGTLNFGRGNVEETSMIRTFCLGACALFAAVTMANMPAAAQHKKKPNIVMLMTGRGWNDFGAYSGGGLGLGHPTPGLDIL